MSDKYFTPHGHKKLLSELEWLIKSERPAVTAVVSWAASLGDRSENADYQYSKKRLREIDRRIKFLQGRLDKAIIIDPLNTKSDVIKFSATVDVVDENGEKKRYTIVGIDEVDTKRNLISFKSPIGQALLGKKIGESAIIKAPQGEREVEIEAIHYQEILIEEFVGESSVSHFNR